jgi:hypothetical protein
MKRTQPFEILRRRIGPLFFQAAICILVCVSFLTNAQTVTNSSASTNAPVETSGALLEFLDGSTLHGQLNSADSEKGLQWTYPDAKQPIHFKPENLAWIRFQKANEFVALASEPTCQFRFANGDEFYGTLLSLDDKEVELQAWFGAKFKTPRETVRSIRFLPRGRGMIYEGPTGLEGWQVGKTPSPQAWRYEDGAFVASASGTLGRELNLADASRLEFDLEWSAPFNFLLAFYTGVFDGFNYSHSCYMFYITPGNISLQRINAGSGSSVIGRTDTIAAMLSKQKARLEFRANKEANLLEVLVDGKSVGQWKDTAGWVAKGSGILFYAQNEGGVKLSNIKASEWSGKSETEIATNALSSDDHIYLANRDKVSGKIAAFQNGKVKLNSTTAALEIPLQRVTQIFFGGANTNPVPRNLWEIQASISGGGTISFALEKWNNDQVLGQNKNFGKISLDPETIREVQFNLNQSKLALGKLSSPDDIIWEGDE